MICSVCNGSGNLMCLNPDKKLEWWECVCCGGDGCRSIGIHGKPISISTSQSKFIKSSNNISISNKRDFCIKDFEPNTKLSHVMHKAGIFKSISDANRNGWDKPIETGSFLFKKKNIVVNINE